MSRKRVLLWILVCLILAAGAPAVSAAASERVPWKVEHIGTFYVPGDWQAVQIDLKKELTNGQKPEDVLKVATVDPPNGMAKPADKFDSLDVQVYQVTLNDGEAYHLAWLMFLRSTKKMTREEKRFFSEEMIEEDKVKLKRFVSGINSNTQQIAFDDPQRKAGFTLIEMAPVEFLKMNKKPAFAGGGRMLISSDGMIFPLYGKGYVFDAKGYSAAALLVTLDGERIFWEPVLRSVMASLNRR